MKIEYVAGDYRENFWTPYQEYSERIGQPFTLVNVEVNASENCDGTMSDMYRIKFNDGAEIIAWPEEVFKGTVDGKPNP